MNTLIAGAGAVASIGSDAGQVFDALCAGRSGLAPLRAFDRGKFRAMSAFEIDDRQPPGRDTPGRATGWLISAIAEAAADAGIGDDLSNVPILIGTGLRELRSAELSWRGRADFDLDRLDFGAALAERFGAAATYTFANACSASLYALALGADLVTAGETDTVVVAGVDALTESMCGLLDRAQPGSPDRIRALDVSRNGTLLGEGAAAVVLRPAGRPQGTGGHGTLRAVSVNCDAFHVTAPDHQGMAAAIRDAHARAGVNASDIDLIVLHATGTPLNDEAEVAAIGAVFGAEASRPMMTGLKPLTGHTSGGSGLLSLVVAMRALATGRVPPLAGLQTPLQAAAAFRFAGDRCQGQDLRLAQVNAFGFGGVNAVAIVEGVPAR
jgi:3-oxoacyl-[acyl-carrier-protein] synthase II